MLESIQECIASRTYDAIIEKKSIILKKILQIFRDESLDKVSERNLRRTSGKITGIFLGGNLEEWRKEY